MSTTHVLLHAIEHALRLPERPDSRWHRAGVTPRAERAFTVLSGLVLMMFALGWSWSIAMARSSGDAPTATASVAAALTDADAPSTAYLTAAALEAFTPERGESGKLRAQIRAGGQPLASESLPAGAQVAFSSGIVAESALALAAPQESGVWQMALKLGSAIRPVSDFNLITLIPFSAKRGGRIGLYYIGTWPTERARRPRPGYAPPSGFIEVTPDNDTTHVSEHFQLRDFLTHDQPNVWPKYLVLDTRLVDKLELVLLDLQEHGVDISGVQVMSGFRTPRYNAAGGDPSGRAALSRHMYGDAADIFIDSDRDGQMDDLNHDRRIGIGDARVIEAAVDRVERSHPALVGGCGVYVAAPGHGPFTHIDTRGFQARWVGTGDS